MYSKPKRDLASKSQMITWQKQWCNMEKVSADPQRDNERRTDEGGRKTGEIKQVRKGVKDKRENKKLRKEK